MNENNDDKLEDDHDDQNHGLTHIHLSDDCDGDD